MKRSFVFLLILFIVGAGIAAAVRYFMQSPKNGRLSVKSNSEATIYLDNVHIGRTPYDGEVMEGEYTLKLTAEQPSSDTAWQGKITVNPGTLTYVNADLGDSEFNSAVEVLWLEKISSKNSEISLVTNPDGASVTLDNEAKGISPVTLADISPGDHTLTVTSPGFDVRTINIKTTAGFRLLSFIKMALVRSDTVVEDDEPEATDSSDLIDEATVSAFPKTTVQTTPKSTVTPKPTKTTLEKPYITISDTPTGFLRVRDEATTGSAEVGRVEPGDSFALLDTETDAKNTAWYKIEYEDEKMGWVSSQYADLFE